jgi:hypothetical protein
MLRLVLGLGSVLLAVDVAPVAKPVDPFAVTRGCVAVLDRFVACATDKAFAGYRTRWVTAGAGDKNKTRADIEKRLAGWGKRDARRGQCAIWSRREGAAEHLAEGTALAKLAADRQTISCAAFGKALDEDGWLPTALVDLRSD